MSHIPFNYLVPRESHLLPWQQIQKTFVDNVSRKMKEQRINAKVLCGLADISQSHWSEIKGLKKAITLDRIDRVSRALGLQASILLQTP